MINKLKELFRSKTAKISIMLSGMFAAMCLTAFANTPTPDTMEIMENAFKLVKDDILKAIAVALPIALTVVGAVIAVKFGIRFFRGVAK